ncbi:MAG: 16S rRNA (guanine(966)-N(2))-methyltransferase RsmD [Jatrophihabitantaceae bacterium]
MRIVGGSAKGRRLTVPPAGTRPTSDRAREAMFNSLRSLVDLDGAHVLDLFAGTGAVGLEALSRGAATVTFVESDRAACEVLRRNVDAVALPGATVVRRPVESVLATATTERAEFVFADPPYVLSGAQLSAVLARLVVGGWLAGGAILVVERSARDAPLAWPDGVTPVMNRGYGEGALWYGRAQ